MRMLPLRSGDVSVAALLVAALSLMILPLPTVLIDTLLAVNIGISLLLMMVTMYIPTSLSLSSFPSLLLFTTLFRLSLNIASTKAILLHANAGHLIESFGQLVVGGNLAVGIVVFLIITIVQFIVINKGSERIAEVGARFTLDAMPGKQMSIDADMRAGAITMEEAQRKRALLVKESQLFGGMDGAMKFVKGDSIAGLVITTVNIVAGIMVGMVYHGMAASEAANRFAVLSIGDAMVSQIPSLMICVAAGIMITRVSDDTRGEQTVSVGEEIIGQLAGNTSALYLAGGLLLGFAAIPGFPWLQFLLLAAALFVAGVMLSRRHAQSAQSKGMPALKRQGAKGNGPGVLPNAPPMSRPLAVRLSPALAQDFNETRFNAAFGKERMSMEEHLGLPFPGLAIWISEAVQGYAYEILLHDVPVAGDSIPSGHVLMPAPSAETAALCLRQESVTESIPAYWLPLEKLSAMEQTDFLYPEHHIARHAAEQARKYAHRFIGIQEVQWMLDLLAEEYSGLVAELQKVMPPQRTAEVLRRLLEEQVPVRNLRAIVESLVIWAAREKDPLVLCEYVRGDLGAYLAHVATGGSGNLCAIFVDGALEQAVREAIRQTTAGSYLALSSETASRVVDAIAQAAAEPRQGMGMVVAMDVRRYFRRLIEGRLPWLNVYSFQELGGQVRLQPVDTVMLPSAPIGGQIQQRAGSGNA